MTHLEECLKINPNLDSQQRHICCVIGQLIEKAKKLRQDLAVHVVVTANSLSVKHEYIAPGSVRAGYVIYRLDGSVAM